MPWLPAQLSANVDEVSGCCCVQSEANCVARDLPDVNLPCFTPSCLKDLCLSGCMDA